MKSARVTHGAGMGLLAGTAVFSYNQQPCRLDYHVTCDTGWQTVAGHIAGWVGDTTIAIDIVIDSARRWWLNGAECPQVAGCTDLDLNFSPSTNMLPIRRLGLAVGQRAAVKAAWLRFPSFTFEPLEQVYQRVDDELYRYESADGAFVADLSVNHAGFVTTYPTIWECDAVTVVADAAK